MQTNPKITHKKKIHFNPEINPKLVIATQCIQDRNLSGTRLNKIKSHFLINWTKQFIGGEVQFTAVQTGNVW